MAGASAGQITVRNSHRPSVTSAAVAAERKITENEHGERQPHAGIGDGDDQEQQRPRHLLAARRHAEHDQAEADDQQPERDQADRQHAEPGEEFAEQQRVAIDRLRQNARQRAPVVLAVDGVEAEPDRHQRREKAEERHERGQRFARGGEQAQEQKRVLRGDVADVRMAP